MESIPKELLAGILTRLDKSTQLNAGLTCKKWQDLLSDDLPRPLQLHITLDSIACNATVCYRTDNNTVITLCQCNDHRSCQMAFLRELFTLLGGRLTALTIEDSLYDKKNEEKLFDASLHMALRDCGSQLGQLHFHSVEMSGIRPWTLAAIAKFSQLTAVSFENCVFPKEFNESLLNRLLAPSYQTLESICVTDNSLISDKFGMAVAKKCVKLKELVLNGCTFVTALTVIGFCESMMNHQYDMINLYLRNCSFNPSELERHLHNPLLSCGPCWKALPVTITIGYDRDAIVLENTMEPTRVIIIHY
jgi:hypothetical protein